MINDVEDADDDATNPKKAKRNPLCNGSLSRSEGYFLILFALLIYSLGLLILGLRFDTTAVALLGVASIVIMTLYSWKKVRLKSQPVFDILSHVFMLAGAPFLLAYVCFKGSIDLIGWLGFAITVMGSFYGVIENQIRDYETDRKTKIKNTVSFIGLKFAKALQALALLTTVLLVLYYINTLPERFQLLVEVVVIFGLLSLYPLLRYLKQKDKEWLKLDMHRVLLISAYLVLLFKIFGLL